MGRLVGPPIKKSDQEWIVNQRIFFHASAPLSGSMRVNVSPKSASEFRVINDRTVCWLDLSGSGSETAAHILENGRLTIMFVALNGQPKIMRLHGRGRLVLPDSLMNIDTEENILLRKLYDGNLIGQPNYDAGFRAIVVMDVERLTHSCGYSIPIYDYKEERPILKDFSAKKGTDGMCEYRGYKNSYSIDGLPSIGQLEQRDTPSSVESSAGYYFAKYGGGFLGKVSTALRMTLHRGLVGLQRDVGFLTLGAALGVVLARLAPGPRIQ